MGGVLKYNARLIDETAKISGGREKPPPRINKRNQRTNETKRMKLSEKRGGDFTPHPETDGTVKAVIVDVTPLKKVQSQYGEREVFRLVYETEVEDAEHDNRRHCVWSRPYTPSLNEKSNFRKDIKKILGRDLTQAELDEFDTEALVGKGVKLIIQHEEGQNGQTYAVISFVSPDKDSPLKASGAYKRVKDREERGDQPSGGGSQATYKKAPAATEDEGRDDWQRVKVHVGKHAGVDLGDLDSDAVEALIDKWLPMHKANAKPKADDKRLADALEQVMELLGATTATEEF